MDERLARILAMAAVRSARELGDLAPLLKDHSSEFAEKLKMGIGEAIYDIYENLLNPVLEEFPNLKGEYERNLEEFERFC